MISCPGLKSISVCQLYLFHNKAWMLLEHDTYQRMSDSVPLVGLISITLYQIVALKVLMTFGRR
jgi:hypothetical protein